MLESVPTSWDIKILCDGDPTTYNNFHSWKQGEVLQSNKVIGSVAARNKLIPLCADGCLYGADDIVFHEADDLVDQFNAAFSDDDGVLGIRTTGQHKQNPAAFALVGQTFLQRYPGKQLFLPAFYHFACQEVMRLAQKVGKWAVTNAVHIQHNHDYTGQTSREARMHSERDHLLIKDRMASGKIWGG